MRFTLALCAGLALPCAAWAQGAPQVFLGYNSTPLSLASGQQAPLQGDSAGDLKVDCVVGCTGGGGGGSGGTVAQGTAAAAAGAWPFYLTQGSTPAALSATNPIFGSIVQGGNTATVDTNGNLHVTINTTASGNSSATPTPTQQQDANGNIIGPAHPLAVQETSTAITAATMPAGGTGAIGWLSAIWAKLAGTLTTTGTITGTVNANSGNYNYTLGSGFQTPTVTAGAYTAGQQIGGQITFAGLLRAAASTGTLQKALLTFNDTQTPVVDLVLFNAAPTATTLADNTTFSLAAADVQKVVGVIHLTDTSAAGTPTIVQALQLQLPFIVGAAGGSIYGVLVTRTAITLGSTSDVSIALVGYSD